MSSTSCTSRLAAAVSPLALALGLLAAGPAHAQETPPVEEQADADKPAQKDTQANPQDTEANRSDDAPGAIVVTGFRAALQSAVTTKKRQDQVVESVTAEDIGKLPDNGIGESIARLPGLAAQRAQGRANIISIRGFGPDFSTTTLNGREQTTTNDSRAVEFDQFPSEILNQVVVYTTSAANLTAGGIVGSIDLRTIRPLAAGKRIMAVGLRGSYVDQKLQPDSSDKGYRVFGTFVDQFADDRMGVALSASYTDEPYQTRDWNAWGYGGYDADSQLMTGVKTWVESSKLKRFGLNGTLQAKVAEQLTLTADAFYSNFKDHVDQRGFEFPDFPAWGFSTLTNVQEEGGLVTGGTFSGIYGIVENYANDRDADLYSLGFNAAFDGQNGWTGMVDFGWSRTDRKDRFLQTTAGTGRARSGASDTISFDWSDEGPQFDPGLNYADPSLIQLTDVQGWGWFNGPINQAGYDNTRTTRDDLRQFRAEIDREIGGGFLDSIKFGVNYTERDKKLSAVEAYLVPAGGVDEIAVPNELLLDPVNLDRGIGPILTYDPRAIVAAGVLTAVPNNFGDSKGYRIHEGLLTPYVMADIRSELGIGELTGNVGVQAVRTKQESTGLTYPNGVPTSVTVGTKYWEYLPSLNLALRMPSDLVIRAGASKQIMRPRMPQLSTNIGYGTDTTQGIIVGGGGNPYLKPYKATALDFNVEKYFGGKGYVALQTFYKHLDRYIAGGFTEFDYSAFPPPNNPPASPIGRLFTDVNTKGGYIYGAELAATLPFEVFSPNLAGFGLTGGGGYTKTRVKDFNGNYSEIPGYSKWVGSLTGFYENHGFNARASMRYRSKYIGDFALYSGGLDRQTVLAETIFDAQVGYDFQPGAMFEGLSVYLAGQNLTDERAATIAPSVGDQAFLKYQTYGRRFLGGLTYKFR